MWSLGKCQGTGPIRLKASPIRIEDLKSITPMGLMVGGHVTPSDHLGMQSSKELFDVVAPADGFIVAIQLRNMPTLDPANPGEKHEYQIIIEHSCTFWTFLDLINELDPMILKAVAGAPEAGVSGSREITGGPASHFRIPVKAGQVLGVVRGKHGIDFAVVNTEVTLAGFVVPAHYNSYPAKIHTVDPFDYYDEPLKSRMLEFNPRKTAPRGGKIDYDVDGRLIGNWFLEGTNGLAGSGRDRRLYWKNHLSIVYHHIDASKITVSMGDFGGTARQYWVKGNSPDPAVVSETTGIVKYELVWAAIGSNGQAFAGRDERVQGILLAQVMPGRKARIEAFPGKTASEVKGFTANAKIFER